MKNTVCLSPTEIEDRLQSVGIQATAQRIAICRFVLCEARHPTAEDVKAWADKNFPKLSLATVYNTLKTLVDAGLLREFKFPHSEKVIYDNNLEKHFHFLDDETGELIDIDPADLEVEVRLSRKFKVKDVEVFIRGSKG